jgi:hypothetical protein
MERPAILTGHEPGRADNGAASKDGRLRAPAQEPRLRGCARPPLAQMGCLNWIESMI